MSIEDRHGRGIWGLSEAEWRELYPPPDPTPPPKPPISYPQDPVIEEVLNRVRDRADAGMKKFGHSMMDDPKSALQWVDDAIEEALDLAAYLTRLKRDLQG